MISAKLHVVGSAHQARFSESFDPDLTSALQAAYDPVRAARDLDELTLLGVLAHYAAAGSYYPVERVAIHERLNLVRVAPGASVAAPARRLLS